MGFSYAGVAVKSAKDGNYLVQILCNKASAGKPEVEKVITKLKDSTAYCG
jgi:hypothetical protein